MNLATMTPLKQVAHILAACAIGEMPDMPPFLKVDAAAAKRRKKWWDEHPPVTVKFGSREGALNADERPEAKEFARREAERRAQAEKAAAPSRRVSKIEVRDMTGFTWDHRRGRFIPDGYAPTGKLTAPASKEELALAAKQHALNALKPVAKKAAKAKAEATPKAAPAAPVSKDGEHKMALLLRMLKRAEGATLQEISVATGWKPHTAGANISVYIKQQAKLLVDRTVEQGRGSVYRVED